MLQGFDGLGERRVIQAVQFWADLGLLRGGELPFLEAEVALRERARYALQK